MKEEKKEPKEKKKFECQYCGQTFNKVNLKTNHEKYCEANPNSPKSLKKLDALKKAREELQQQPIPEPAVVQPVQPPQQLQQVEQAIQDQTLKQEREEQFLDLRADNKTRREILAQQRLDKQLASNIGETDPVDKLLKLQQLKLAGNLGGQDSGQGQLLQIQAQNYQSQITTQAQMFEMQKQLQAQQFDFFKQQLANEKDKNSGLSQIKEVTELAKELGWKKDDSDKGAGEYVMENIGKIVEVAAPIFKEMALKKQQGQGLPTEQTQTPQSVPEQINPIPGGEETSQEGASFITPSQDVLQPSIAPKQLTDEEVEAYAKKNYLTEGDDPTGITAQSLASPGSKYGKAREKYN